MLAVKLHRQKRVNLRKGSALVPIVAWDTGTQSIHECLRWAWGRKTDYLTLVQIPDNFPVKFLVYFFTSRTGGPLFIEFEYHPLRDTHPDLKRDIGRWWDAYRISPDEESEPGGPCTNEPSVYLGKKLPDSCIKWTKRLQLLYRSPKNKRAKSKREARDRTR